MKNDRQQILLAVVVTFVVTAIVGTMIHSSIVRELDESFQFELEMRQEEIAELEMLLNGL